MSGIIRRVAQSARRIEDSEDVSLLIRALTSTRTAQFRKEVVTQDTHAGAKTRILSRSQNQ